ncbi:MAG: hypothetical protein RLZZ15_3664, partial [Verrucomicrobiota bacterium]
DVGAALDLLRLDPATGRVTTRQTLAQLDGHIMQMGEWVRFANGDLANFIDVQTPASATTRAGLHAVWSRDGGKTFGPLARVGVIDGVEYGYAFDAVTEGATTWMLAMTFSNLAGGKSVDPPRPHAGSVDVIRTEDNGRSWRFVRNLSHEFGDVPLNESALLRHGDGWLVSTRGYDNRQRLHRTDATFRVVAQTDLTATHAIVGTHVGRPRLFARDGGVYLLGRSSTQPANAAARPMQLALYRLDPAALTIAAYAILDNAENARVTDGYYAVPYFRGTGAETRMHVVTYKGSDGKPPDLMHLTFRWADVN